MMNSQSYRDTSAEDHDHTHEATPISEMHRVGRSKNKQPKQSDKGKSFAVKEKRKRDLGMSSRGKSTVEEEKRILRQQSGSYGHGFD
eukprot:m.341311 g.341311  ORF g.341311 m.341311 type:complete len:87 (+) comp19999_c0_seq1:582-842(+)